jgi:hypothetical protein
MTSTSALLLARLNDLRTAAKMSPLKHPLPIAKMNDAIAALTPPPASRTSFFANLCREYKVDPKVGRNLYRRHIGPVSQFNPNDPKQVEDARRLLAASAARIAA